jgi:hypothetical protein
MSGVTRLSTAVSDAVRDGWRLLREATGENAYQAYADQCRRAGAEPLSRRQFERQRQDHRDHAPQARCC